MSRACALEARRVEVDPERYEAEAVGEVENVDGVLVIRRITVTYRLGLPDEHHHPTRPLLTFAGSC